MTEINRYHIFVSSELRTPGSKSSNDFSVAVNPPLVLSHPNHYFVAQIMSVEIPYSWLQVNSGNNTLGILYETNGGAFAPYTITLTPGNYNVNTLLTALGSAIDAVIPVHTWKHNYVYNQDTGKITFGIKDAGAYTSVAIAINFPANSFLARMFGCLAQGNVVYGYASLTYQNVTGTTNINVNPVSSIYIRSTNLKQIKNQESLVLGEGQDPSDILCKLQIYTPPRTYVFYNGELGLSARITNPIIDKLDLYLSDNYSYDLDMMNNDWTFRISFYEMKPLIITEAHDATLKFNGTGVLNGIGSGKEPETKEEEDPAVKERKFQK
jgi:hypothetical protein